MKKGITSPDVANPSQDEEVIDSGSDATEDQKLVPPYTLDNISTEGCFVTPEKLKKILSRLRTKKNLILQGPPGTGKTWLARRLAFALIGKRDESKVRAVQFHPNLSYEDFIHGCYYWGKMGEITLWVPKSQRVVT